MARNRQGWTLRRRTQGGVWYVRFTVAGRTTEPSTGTSDREQAAREAERIYADAIARERKQPKRRGRRGVAPPLEDLIGAWIEWLSSTHEASTLETWELYARTHFIPFFDVAHNLTSAQGELYTRKRLGLVLASTVKRERTALLSFATFLYELGVLPEPLVLEPLPKRSAGTPHPKRRRSAPMQLEPAQIKKLIASLPEWSESRKVEPFPVRARFLVAYETSLRPSTLDKLETPKHFRKGARTLRITKAIDKAKWDRDVPLTDSARKALERALPSKAMIAKRLERGDARPGLIFGRHDYRDQLRQAAAEAFPPEVAERFAGAHLRSARITHLLEQTGNLPGVQHLAGHRLTSTTARYVRPSFRAAQEALGILGAPRNSGGQKSAKGGT